MVTKPTEPTESTKTTKPITYIIDASGGHLKIGNPYLTFI